MKDLLKYNPNDMVMTIGKTDSYDPKDYITITGFADEPFTSPRMWHRARQLESGNWIVSITHKFNRVVHIELSDESYKKYGFAEMKPGVISPFGVTYDDANLVPVK